MTKLEGGDVFFSHSGFVIASGFAVRISSFRLLLPIHRGEGERGCAIGAMNGEAEERMRRLGVKPEELEERFARSSGPGGQHVNKVSTAVTLKHRPSGVTVTVQDSRSQARNRALALERLLDALERRLELKRAAQRAALSRERRRNSPRPPRLKREILEQKRNRSQLKRLRAKPIE